MSLLQGSPDIRRLCSKSNFPKVLIMRLPGLFTFCLKTIGGLAMFWLFQRGHRIFPLPKKRRLRQRQWGVLHTGFMTLVSREFTGCSNSESFKRASVIVV